MWNIYLYVKIFLISYRKLKNIGWRQGGEMTQALYAHMNNKKIYMYNHPKLHYQKSVTLNGLINF
jgi:hypothetical protein